MHAASPGPLPGPTQLPRLPGVTPGWPQMNPFKTGQTAKAKPKAHPDNELTPLPHPSRCPPGPFSTPQRAVIALSGDCHGETEKPPAHEKHRHCFRAHRRGQESPALTQGSPHSLRAGG